MRVELVDPPAYSPPYDHALAAALGKLGVSVRLLTSRFAYGEAPTVQGYEREERFYRHAVGAPGSRLRAASKRAEHLADMLGYRREASADVVHFQWLTVPRLDLRLLPPRPTVLTIHDPLERGRQPLPAAAFRRVDAIVVHSEHARERVLAQHGFEPERVSVIRHGALRAAGPAVSTTGSQRPGAPARGSAGAGGLPPELADTGEPVVLSYGLIRPYKGVETLLEAWRGIAGAQLWIVGRPMMDLAALRVPRGSASGDQSLPAQQLARQGPVQIIPRFVTASEEAALFERADLVVLPYEHGERFGFSGVLATALGHGRAIVLSDIGGFTEVGRLGAARLVAPGDPDQLHDALAALVADDGERARLAAAAAKAAADTYSWERAARATLELYERIRSR